MRPARSYHLLAALRIGPHYCPAAPPPRRLWLDRPYCWSCASSRSRGVRNTSRSEETDSGIAVGSRGQRGGSQRTDQSQCSASTYGPVALVTSNASGGTYVRGKPQSASRTGDEPPGLTLPSLISCMPTRGAFSCGHCLPAGFSRHAEGETWYCRETEDQKSLFRPRYES